ncbi:MAG: histidine kinase [Deltaproteobacteria bacterium]|nr:histidine kinase [Deltaproteobacteria bacterium]
MEAHFESPEFRKNALAVLERSLNKIKNMCSRLSLLSQGFEMKKERVDLNRLMNETLKTYDGALKGKIIRSLLLSQEISAGHEPILKALTNLILNANEALNPGGEIRIETGQKNGWVVLSVADNGCGMSKEFIKKPLFRPFKTTKKQGMGIGLFHFKIIAEAHGGKIEVENEKKVGTKSRVLLPVK